MPAQPELFDRAPQHIGQKRFYDFNVWTERKRVEKLRYLHRNPVKRGLVESPEQWRWSSYRAHAFGEAGPVKVNEWQVLKMKIRTPTASEPTLSVADCPAPHFSQRTREMGHPEPLVVS